MFNKVVTKVRKGYLKIGQVLGASLHAPSRKQIQVALFVIGITLVTAGMSQDASAGFGGSIGGSISFGGGGGGFADMSRTDFEYNDTRITDAVNVILTYIEGSFGALVMVAAGLGAILSSAFGQYRAALGCLIVAVGSFILRSVMGTFFNTTNIQE